MFSFAKFYLFECVGYLNVTNGQKSLLDLFPDICRIVDLETLEGDIWFCLFWQPPEFGNVKESS